MEISSREQIEEMAEYIFGNAITHDTQFKEDCRSIARDLYNAGYRKQEWISVDERKPRESEVVLVYSEKFGVLHRIYTTYKGETRWWSDEYWSNTEQLGITHWMPLPEAPKMKGGAE